MSESERLAPVTYLPGASAQASAAGAAESRLARTAGEGASETVERALPSRQEKRAANVSIHGLSRRNMSRWEVERLLLSRELDEEVIAAEIERLEGVGLIDDVALAETLVRTRHERKGLGRQALTSEMSQRHIDPAAISAALELLTDDDERDRAFELAAKRAPQLERFDSETARRRLSGYLLRRGYGSGVVREAVDSALGRGAARGGGGGGVRFQ